MSARGVGLAGLMLACGCALVSGLSNLEVVDASRDASDAPPSDVTVLPDTPLQEAGTGGYALSVSGGCASGLSSFSFSNLQFSVTFWLRVDALPASLVETVPVVWNGGRGASEQGWSVNLNSKGLVFCVADQNGGTCTPTYTIAVGHLVHIGAVSPYTGLTSGRTLDIYALDHSMGDTTHTLVASAIGAQGNWTSSAPFTIGGAQIGSSCTSTSNVTVDRVHLFQNTVLTLANLDSSAGESLCTAPSGPVADFEFDEGSGTVAKDCVKLGVALQWAPSAKVGFVISPFP